MCNLFENTVSFADLVRAFAGAGRPILKPEPHAAPNLPLLEQIRPTDAAPVARRFGEGAELLTLRWGLRAPRPRSGPVTNLRAEGRRFDERADGGRCLAPATAFFEFTGGASPKTRWRFAETGRPWFCLAGVWRADADGQARFSLLTIEAGPDMAPYHNRQPVVLPRAAWGPWLARADETALLRAGPAGALTVSRASPPPPAPTLPLFGDAL